MKEKIILITDDKEIILKHLSMLLTSKGMIKGMMNLKQESGRSPVLVSEHASGRSSASVIHL